MSPTELKTHVPRDRKNIGLFEEQIPEKLTKVDLSENATTVLAKRYLKKDQTGTPTESQQDMFWRVAKVVANVDREYGATEKQVGKRARNFYKSMVSGKFVPNSPTLMNAGRALGQLSACFVLPVSDALTNGKDGIYDTLRAMAVVHQSGGGTGFSFSNIRPEGDFVKSTSGVASGPISFMKLYDASTDVVKQGGTRRGANMGILRIDHPDIRSFITCKNDLTQLTNFNISVAVTDDFMRAVKNNTTYDLIHPKNGKKVGKENAADIFNLILHGAWKSGEPGIFFIDRSNEYNPVPHMGQYEATNPCMPGWAPVLTLNGISKLENLEIGDRIWGGDRWVTISNKWSTGIKKVYAYHTNAGVFYGTDNHRIVSNGLKVPVGEAESLDICKGPSGAVETDLQSVLDGLIVGDGCLNTKRGKEVLLIIGDKDGDYFDDPVSQLIEEPKEWDRKCFVTKTTITPEELPPVWERTIPDRYFYGNRDKVISFLRGLYSANGSTCGSRVTLKATSLWLIKQVQMMLSSIGIVSYYTTNKPSTIEWDNGIYTSKESYDLNISSDREEFYNKIGFIQKYKQEKLLEICNRVSRGNQKTNYDITELELVSEEEVFDITVDSEEHVFWTGGVLVSNCGEVPLLAYDVCNLGSINLGKFLLNGKINWTALRKVVHESVVFLDNTIDANYYPLEEIHCLAQRIRRVGLGVMGWADMLVRMGIPYDSEKAIKLAKKVMSFINDESRIASENLAKTRGVFPEWEKSIWGPDETCARRQDGNRVRELRYLRNCNLTTIAPTGTISIIAGCSGGIEPLFAVAFMRNQAGALMPDVNPDFVKVAKEQGWYSEELLLKIAKEGHINFSEVPNSVKKIFRVSHDISPEWHVKMQAAFQEHCDSAISKTTNFANSATEEDVRKIYELAFELGCKGVTVYRDGSRNNQVLSTGKTANESQENLIAEIARLKSQLSNKENGIVKTHKKTKRPKALRGYTMKMLSPLGDLYTTINEDESKKPFEVFCTLGKAGGAANADAEAIGRLISLSLRSGIPIEQIKNQLRGISCDRAVGIGKNKVLSMPDAIGQVIDLYLQDQEPKEMSEDVLETRDVKAESILVCPECSSSHMTFEEGCVKCYVCGYSECG